MQDKKIQAMLNAVAAQRDQALNALVNAQAEIAVMQDEINQLKAKLEPADKGEVDAD